MIVDDEALVALFVADVVEDLGFQVIGPVRDVEGAIAAAETHKPQAAIVDVGLGNRGASGLDVARELADRHGTAVIFLSGYADLERDPDVQALKPVAILQKPCLPEHIEAALKAALG
ncbi:response regulator [Propylenella binzhouense]|nr:response regulator [Propylenella binzhouense]